MNFKIELLKLSGIRNKHTKKGMKKNKQSLKGLWDKIKHVNLHTMKVSKGREREKREEKIFLKIMTKHFPNLMRNISSHV